MFVFTPIPHIIFSSYQTIEVTYFGDSYYQEVRALAETHDASYQYDDPASQDSLRAIERTNNCDELKKMFIDNWAWSVRDKLANKIVNILNCPM